MSGKLAALVSLLLLTSVGTCWPQSSTEREWTDKHFTEVLDHLFPLNQRAGVYVAYRSHRDLYTDAPEYWLLLGREASADGNGLNPYLTARVRVADPASIYDQMTVLHRKRPNDSVEQIERQVQIKEWTFTETNCPAVKSQFVSFEHLRFTMPRFDEIVLHPLLHEIRVQGGTGDFKVVLTKEENELVRWALKTRRALESCATSARVN